MPLVNVMGNEGCHLLFAGQSTHNSSLASGGFAMATFRTVAIMIRDKPTLNRLSNETMRNIWMAMKIALLVTLVGTNWIGVEIYGSGLTMQFCKGRSSTMEGIIMAYDGVTKETLDFGFKLTKAVYVLGQLLIICELACYIYLFCYVHQHNSTMGTTVSPDELRRRHKGNVINLTGQAMVFALETVLVVSMHVLMQMKNNSLFPPASFSVLLIGVASLIHMSYITGSPEIRRHYLPGIFH